MFNFQSTTTNFTQIRSRASVSDPELHHRMQNQSRYRSTGPGPSNRVTLPPIATRSHSVTHARHPAVMREPPPRKLPSPKEMIFLTLKHVKPCSIRGLTFDQLYSFITGAFEIPRSYTLESKLRKTISNMESKGVVEHSPGIEPRYSTYRLPENRTRDPNQSFCISGKSIAAAPMWPTGYTLPAGGSLICRAGPRQKMQVARPETQIYHQNPHSRRADPMPYMPTANPMLCQSFGARAGLVGRVDEGRPNSRNSGAGDFDDFNSCDNEPTMYNSDARAGDNPYQKCSNFPPMSMRSSTPPRMLDTVPQSWSLDINQDQDDEEIENIFVNKCDEFYPSHKNSQSAIISHEQMQMNPDSYRSEKSMSETREDFENRRSCEIMNDLRMRDTPISTPSSPALEAQASNLNQMDYLLGIADIIDNYDEEPPKLKISGATTSRSKTALKSGKGRTYIGP